VCAIQEPFSAGIAIGRLDDAGPIEAYTAASAPRLLKEVCAANSCPCEAGSVLPSAPLHGKQLKSRDTMTASLHIDESSLLRVLLSVPSNAAMSGRHRTWVPDLWAGIRGLLAAPRNSRMPESETGTCPDAGGRQWTFVCSTSGTPPFMYSTTEDGGSLTGSDGRTVVPPKLSCLMA
jgi:hypothetical protein